MQNQIEDHDYLHKGFVAYIYQLLFLQLLYNYLAMILKLINYFVQCNDICN